MPTEISRSFAPTIESAPTSPDTGRKTNSPDAGSLGLTPLAIAAVLALTLHLVSGVMLDRSHASPAGAALDQAIACAPADASPPQPSVPHD